MTQLAQQQGALTRHLRDPECVPAPEGIEPRRLKIYQELLYNNVEGFLRGGFPIFRSLLDDARWARLVRQFFVQHRAHSPYFLEISEEFRAFIEGLDLAAEKLPPFTIELLHYEWLELALDVSAEVLPECSNQQVDDDSGLTLSPLAVVLAYQYPVQQLGPDYQPDEPPEAPTFLVVHRDSTHRVRFVALNGLTYALLNQVEQAGTLTLAELAPTLHQMVQGNQVQDVPAVFKQQLQITLQQLADQQILLIC